MEANWKSDLLLLAFFLALVLAITLGGLWTL